MPLRSQKLPVYNIIGQSIGRPEREREANEYLNCLVLRHSVNKAKSICIVSGQRRNNGRGKSALEKERQLAIS